jgi:uncharacterized iron-regulated protein
MAFKLCLTVMNAPQPNSSTALDLLVRMESFDKKYNNLHDTIFKHYIDESNMILNNERYPILVTINNKDSFPLLVRVLVCGLTEAPLLFEAVKRERDSCPEFDSWVVEGQKTRPCFTRM